MKINAHSRLRNVVTANIKEDADIQKFLKSMARRFHSQVSYPQPNKAVLKSKYGSLSVYGEEGAYEIDFRFRKGPVSISAFAEGKDTVTTIGRFHREVSVELEAFELQVRKLEQEAKEIKSAMLEATDLIL